MIADFSEIGSKVNFDSEQGTKDYRFVKWLSRNKKLQGIPPSAFYCDEHKNLGEDFIRFCFFKEETNLEKAEKILIDLKKSLNWVGKVIIKSELEGNLSNKSDYM